MESEFIRFVGATVGMLDGCQIRYAIGGSFASSRYGEPRATLDVDLSVQLSPAHADCFIAQVEKVGWYIFPEGVRQVARSGGDFQIFDASTGIKADFFVFPPQLNARQEAVLTRARRLTFEDGTYTLLSPEDTILYKLEWYLMGKSEKHIRDIQAIIENKRDELDYPYLEHWITILGVQSAWEDVRENP